MRIRAIFRKGQIDIQNLQGEIKITDAIEHALAIKLTEYADLLPTIAEDLQLHRLCEYLYDLASLFHRFYEHCPILSIDDTEIQTSRLLLCHLTAKTLRSGLNLLGIDVLEQM